MSTGKILVIVVDSLAAVGVLAGVVAVLGFFVYAVDRESETPLPPAPIMADDFTPESAPSTAPSSPRPSSDLPPLPLEISVPFRHLSSGGYVAQFHNTSDKLLRVVFNMESVANHTYKTEALDIPASSTVEIGWDRGWILDSGDRVTVTCDGYQAGTWMVP